MNLFDQIKVVGGMIRTLKNWDGPKKKKNGYESKLRREKRTLLGIVVTHRQLCEDLNCLCKSLEQCVPASMYKDMPDLRQKGRIVVFPSDHTDECKQGWVRGARNYCHLACAGLRSDTTVQDCGSTVASLQSSSGGLCAPGGPDERQGAARVGEQHGRMNDCGCPSDATLRFRVAQEQGFSHNPGNDAQENLKDVIEHLMGKHKGQNRKESQRIYA